MKTYILAAGKGTRMKSDIPKSLSLVGGKPIIFQTLSNLIKLKALEITILVGYKAEEIKKKINENYKDIKFLNQDNLNGTGQAVLEILNKDKNTGKDFMVMNADDSLFYNVHEINELIKSHSNSKALVSLFIIKDKENRNYRKVIINKEKKFLYLSKETKTKGYIVTGLYIFNRDFIFNYLLNSSKTDEELRITDFMYLKDIREKINIKIINEENWFGINTKEELILANQIWQSLQ